MPNFYYTRYPDYLLATGNMTKVGIGYILIILVH